MAINMKQMLKASPIVLFVLYAIFPVLKIAAEIFDYEFTLTNNILSIAFLSAITIGVLVFLFVKQITFTKTQSIFAGLLLPISIINGMFYTFADKKSITLYFAFLCCSALIILLFKFIKSNILKAVSSFISILLVILFIFIGSIASIFGGLSNNTVQKTITSPQNTYIAKVIYSDHGAMGGNTLVEVISIKNDIDLLFGKFSKKPIRVYDGEIEENKTMIIKWLDENTLFINGKTIIIEEIQ